MSGEQPLAFRDCGQVIFAGELFGAADMAVAIEEEASISGHEQWLSSNQTGLSGITNIVVDGLIYINPFRGSFTIVHGTRP